MKFRSSISARLIVCGLAAWLACAASMASNGDGAFLTVKAKTFNKDKFVFPESLEGQRLNVLFLSMSDEQDNGQYQQEALLDWQAELDARDVFTDGVMAYHFPVLENPPFFVKGIIASAMRDSYEDKVPLAQAGVLYVKDLEAFAAAAGLTLDKRPTIVIAGPDGRPLHSVKGEVYDDAVDELIAAIQAELAPAPDP